MDIKAYTEEYREDVINLILSIQRGEFGIPITREDQPDLSNIPGFYQPEKGNFWIALCDEQVVGTIALIDIGNNQGALRKMFVKPEYRGKLHNAAGLLLAELLTWARQQGMSEIYLGTTDKFLAAHRFYEKKGFELIDRAMLPKAFPVMKVDTRFYRFSL
jgi:N-acetylglutamate synthase-like GNAT family acetyltransferase